MTTPTTTANPFDTAEARDQTSYAVPRDGFLLLSGGDGPAPPLAQRIHAAFRAIVLDPEFPCVGARSALNQGTYRFALYHELDSEAATAGLARDLYTFGQAIPEIGGEFNSFVACFDTPKVIDAGEFERALWSQLVRLHALDREHFEWDPGVSADVGDPQFSFSFGGRAYFVVGLSPAGERWARQFPWPVLVFNPHDQFERLRDDGKYGRIQQVIRERDTELQGDINPNLSDFGSHTEARQYSGREVGDDWRCPVRFDR